MKYQFLEFEREAHRILEDAKREAELIVGNGRAKLEEEKRLAREVGREEGIQLGIAQAHEKMNEMIGMIGRIEKAVESYKKQFVATIEQDVIALALEMAEKVIGREAYNNREVLANNIKRALSIVMNSSGVHVFVSPQDYELLEPLLERMNLKSDIVIKVDPRLSRGDCLIKTSRGMIDATVKSQVEKLREAVLNNRVENV